MESKSSSNQHHRGTPSQRLKPLDSWLDWDWDEDDKSLEPSSVRTARLQLPIVTLEPIPLKKWSGVAMGKGNATIAGRIFELTQTIKQTTESDEALTQSRDEQKPTHNKSVLREWIGPKAPVPKVPMSKNRIDGNRVWQRFLQTASTEAMELAKLLAAVPLDINVVNMVRTQFVPNAAQVNVAEVFAGGLVKKRAGREAYFMPDEVQNVLRHALEGWDEWIVREALTEYINGRFQRNYRDFQALLEDWSQLEPEKLDPERRVFAEFFRSEFSKNIPTEPFTTIIKQLIVEDLPSKPELITVEVAKLTFTEAFPRLEPMSFTAPCVSFISQEPEHPPLEKFPIRIAQVVKQRNKWIVTYQDSEAYRYLEPLNESVNIEMVPIPAGKFIMGSPEDEIGCSDRESPQHEVTLKRFFMGRYPVTQEQWRLVAQMPQIEQSLEPNPFGFKGELRPVENVRWYEAIEFCQRLSNHTGKTYRLPSEAEWEYACRAGTTSPFHFGQMITTDVANYDGSTYGDGPRGKSRGETTLVNEFNHANAWGLSDMHGNVLEWCEDHWHKNYNNAPTDGSAWVTGGNSGYRVRRGGSWFYIPGFCRSAYRYDYYPDSRINNVGFRLICVPR